MSTPGTRPIRVAARALITIDGRLLLVNGFAKINAIWCVPGGGAEPGEAATEAVRREVYEETGLTIELGPLAGVSEFHSSKTGFHQFEVFFHARSDRPPEPDWSDPAGVVTKWRLADRGELAGLPHRPTGLAAMAFDDAPPSYHGLTDMFLPAGLSG